MIVRVSSRIGEEFRVDNYADYNESKNPDLTITEFGFSPYHSLLSGLGSCFLFHLKKYGVEYGVDVSNYTVEVRGFYDDGILQEIVLEMEEIADEFVPLVNKAFDNCKVAKVFSVPVTLNMGSHGLGGEDAK